MNQLTEMKSAVLQTALGMCASGNFTLPELKAKLIEMHPQFHWRLDTSDLSVSVLTDQLITEGALICTEGVFCDPAPKATPVAVTAPVTTNTVVTPKKRGPYMTKAKKAAAALATKTTTPVATTPVVVKKAKYKTPKITRVKAAELIEKAKGRFGYVIFKKEDGKMREMQFKVLPNAKGSKTGKIKVTDMALYNKAKALSKSKEECFNSSVKTINFQTVVKLALDGQTYRVG